MEDSARYEFRSSVSTGVPFGSRRIPVDNTASGLSTCCSEIGLDAPCCGLALASAVEGAAGVVVADEEEDTMAAIARCRSADVSPPLYIQLYGRPIRGMSE